MEIGGDRQYSMKSDSISRLIHPARERERDTIFTLRKSLEPILSSPPPPWKYHFGRPKLWRAKLSSSSSSKKKKKKKKIIGKPERLAVIGEEALGMRDEIECWKAKCLFSSDVITDKKSGTRWMRSRVYACIDEFKDIYIYAYRLWKLYFRDSI